MADSMSHRSNVPLVIAIVISIVAVAASGWAIYVATIRKPTDAFLSNQYAVQAKMIGLTAPVVNSMDPAFKDANGDLVADAPTDPSKLIDTDTLVFSYVATDNPEMYRDAFKEFCDHVAQETGKSVRYELITNTDDELKAMRDGKLQIAGFSTGTVPAAVDLCGFVPVAMLGGDKSGYQMQIIVPTDSAIQSLDDLRGRELTLTDPNSNSGYKAPLVLLSKDHGMLPGRDFGIVYSGGQNESIAGIANKKYEAAAVASDVLTRAIAAGSIKKDGFRVIFSSDTFPTAALGYVYNLKPEIADKFKAALFDFDWKGTGLEKQFGPSDESKFVPVSFDKDWSIVRRIDDAIGSKYVIR